ncbi:hypothetical protein F4818DRAFT_440071 [Hypoxylon cercidicola]|nr:hypothetical protein F4818DRAFT_440071 [Hypoxylon cercidicola]
MDTSQTSQITKPVNFELPVVPIAPDGDVIFVVGDEKRPLRVHSVFLRTASSVFKAMLGPHYREGANLSSDCPKVIPLPEDDPKAMEIIFNIIHFRFDAVSERYDPESVLCLAIAADKYDFTQALRLSIRDWLQCDNIKDPKKLWKLTKASYFLHNDRAFEATTLGLICHYGGSFFQLNDGNEIYFDFGDRFAGVY